MLLDPHVPMLKGWVGPSSFPRIMCLKVVFQICFGSIKMMGTQGVLIPCSGQLSYFIYVSKRDSCVQQYLQFLFPFIVEFISNKPVLSDPLSYVTIFHCPLGRSHKTGLTVYGHFKKKWLLLLQLSNLLIFMILLDLNSSKDL